ncbi:hypothetical protein GGR27_002074 [Lewinella antarctica]|uniref:Uncharacterized protein n=1 Tax=Neolewinella antarctica TaxID=442734 RepID=A0ABX0XCC0_9BACT|nr:hypothetical protein [Neolewinella antarctica]
MASGSATGAIQTINNNAKLRGRKFGVVARKRRKDCYVRKESNPGNGATLASQLRFSQENRKRKISTQASGIAVLLIICCLSCVLFQHIVR